MTAVGRKPPFANDRFRPKAVIRVFSALNPQGVSCPAGSPRGDCMRRREFVARLSGVMAAWPFAALAQRLTIPFIGYLHSGSPNERAHHIEAFRRGLEEGGFVDGKDVAIEYRWAEGRYDRLPGLATELVKRKVAVIAAATTPAGVAAKAATSTI